MKTRIWSWLPACALLTTLLLHVSAQQPVAVPAPDDRYKADILLVLAHPDDETNVSTYLWKTVCDDGKRVAVLFTTRGNSGGNSVGMEQSKALADEREVEARHSLAAHGITNVWFLRASDTPTQDVLHSLETVGHGEALEEAIRVVRLTRPEVIVTWLPAYVNGENHGDHQAAAVIATEAFDLAGNPTSFPEQVSAPRDRLSISNYGEGLHCWQAKKLYFFSDAFHQEFLAHRGPSYLATDLSSSKGVPFSELNKIAWDFYATQAEATEAMLHLRIYRPDYLVLGKSLVTAPLEGDVFAGIDKLPIAYVPAQPHREASMPPVSLQLGGPWSFYRDFYPAHGLDFLATLVKPQSAFIPNRPFWVPLLLCNNSHKQANVVLHSNFPDGWTPVEKDITYQVEPDSVYPVQIFLKAPVTVNDRTAQILHWSLTADGVQVGEVEMEAFPEDDGLPQ